MLEVSWQRGFIKLLTLGVLVACLILLSYGNRLAAFVRTPDQKATVPVVSVLTQPDTPLRISVLSYASVDPRTPEVMFGLTNVSSKSVRAYVISQTTQQGDEKSVSYRLTDMIGTKAILQPGQYTPDAMTYAPLSEVISHVTLSIDFVEFDDGTTWGPDNHQSVQLLAGRRAGVDEANKHILQVYESEGLEAVLKAIKSDLTVIPPSGNPANWEDGFRYGIAHVSGRFKHLLSKGDIAKFKKELERLSETKKRGK